MKNGICLSAKRILQYFAIISSVSLNVIFLLPYSEDIYHKILKRLHPIEYWECCTPDSVVIQSLIDYAYQDCQEPMKFDEYHGLFVDIKNLFKSKRSSDCINNFNTCYYLTGLSYYTLYEKDSTMLNFLKIKADNFVVGRNLNYKLKRVDQYPIGIFYLNMYKATKEHKYLEVAESIYLKLIKLRDVNDLITYSDEKTIHYVDELGMIIPFLMEYYHETGDKLAYKIAKKNIENYHTIATDSITGLPSHGYDVANNVKLGSAQWGRGIGWYLLALSYYDDLHDAKLDKTIEILPYTQFPFSYSSFDSSTALMCEIYKQSRRNTNIKNIDFIKEKVRKDGIVDFFSGDTYNFNDYSHSLGPSQLGNGLLLMLIYRF